jgi:hypothetical protein
MTTEERNILMAEFKGWSYNEETEKFTKGSLTFRLASFEYHKSWDQLVQIVNLCNKRVTLMAICPEDPQFNYWDQQIMENLIFDFNDMIEAYGLAFVSNDITQAHKITAEWIIQYMDGYEDARKQYEADKYEGYEKDY